MCARSRSGRGWYFVASLLALATVAGGCSNLSYSVDPSAYSWAASAPAAGAVAAAHATANQELCPASDRNGDLSAPGATRSGPARQMVYSARFDVATSNVDEAMGRFLRETQSAGGYLECREDNHVVCRVPAEHFDAFVATIPALGNIVRRMIRNDDVTRKYQDLKLHIEAADWSRRRVLGLLEKAQKMEDVIKLEEELLRLTAMIEGLQGTLRDLSEQIAYSRVEVFFSPRTPDVRMGRPDAQSPFAWINQVGAEQVMTGFGPVDTSDESVASRAAAILPGALPVGPLEGFLVFKRDRTELKAITPDASKLWIREFAVPRRANFDWSTALRNDLVDHRGYALVREDGQICDLKGNLGKELLFDVTVEGQAYRYLVAVYVLEGPFWRPGSIVRTVEFTAPKATFDEYADAVRRSYCRGTNHEPHGF